ncbi:unnamed protein product [Didymodactylos carnosus]|uniref:Uncharacterized protein n=1 Tax=Didymodactylos carnosus TaxID=1234261 RepID=A0A8S2DC48_9BILA|nr:unnamed protein product [Didymodactylos carnosus]CAF3682657.1 unnamed protein product [Didymodactylos carnosus]
MNKIPATHMPPNTFVYQKSCKILANSVNAIAHASMNWKTAIVTTKNVSISEQSKHNQDEDFHQQQETQLQKQSEGQIQSVVSTIPYFEGIEAEAWFSNLQSKFPKLDLKPDIMMYYVKEKFIGMPLIWYYENLSKIEDFSSFVVFSIKTHRPSFAHDKLVDKVEDNHL